MTNCEVCDQELVEGHFEETLGICVSCIMIESREDSYKSFLILFMILIGGIMFIGSFLSVIFNTPSLFVDFEGHIFYFIPQLVWCVISGSGLIYFSVVFKNR
ncbi:MAG: hypothetical protein ACTSPZ_07570 [Promethearchaeota archaeon]